MAKEEVKTENNEVEKEVNKVKEVKEVSKPLESENTSVLDHLQRP